MADDTREIPAMIPVGQAASSFTGDALVSFERDIVPSFLPGQRWFAEKSTAIGAVRLIDIAELDGNDRAFLAIVAIEPAGSWYFVPVAVRSATGDEPRSSVLARGGPAGDDATLVDALALGSAPRVVFDDVRAEHRRPARNGGTFVAHATATLANREVPADLAIRRLSVEQSNTSIVLGDHVMLKAYRRVHRGPQAELEVARFLDAVRYKNTPALLGFVEYEQPGALPAAVCIVQSFEPNRGDGWTVTLAHLAAVAADGHAPESDAAFAGLFTTLGRRTAELHRAFATPIGDPAFEPEPTTDADIAAWVAQARATADAALATLEREGDRVPPELRADAASLLRRRAEIAERLDIPPLGAATLMKTRYHGDFHLGQVLVVEDDVMIVDFEGEPGRDPAVRRRKSSPLRDVAGMLRSIDYAAVVGQSSTEWERRSAAAFLTGYRTAIAGTASYPSDPSIAGRLLDLFILEKAFYELSYELANRPAWLRIPLEGIRTILDADEYARTAH